MSRKDFGAKPFIYPMPVFIIGTYDEEGNPDVMNAAWGCMVGYDKILISLGKERKTTENILKNKAYTISIGTRDTVVACDYVGIESRLKVKDKFAKSGFTRTKSSRVNAPIIDQLPLTLECEFESYDENHFLIGKIINVSADESILTDGKIDVAKLKPIAFDEANNKYNVLGEIVGNAFRDGLQLR